MITDVADASQVAQARRLVSDHARRTGMAEARIGKVAIVVTELATNLLKHGGGGQILADRCSDGEGIGLEILALDRGRGMPDVGRCMDDGYSTSGSPGTGLGAVARLADDVRIYSRPGLGSVIMARFLGEAAGAWTHRSGMGPGHDGHRTLFGAAVAPYPGEQVCGDRWSFSETAKGRTLVGGRRRRPRDRGGAGREHSWRRFSPSTRMHPAWNWSNGCTARWHRRAAPRSPSRGSMRWRTPCATSAWATSAAS
jgi:anti-sigma regulatory factor (Ser/Thr protein kinase)